MRVLGLSATILACVGIALINSGTVLAQTELNSY